MYDILPHADWQLDGLDSLDAINRNHIHDQLCATMLATMLTLLVLGLRLSN